MGSCRRSSLTLSRCWLCFFWLVLLDYHLASVLCFGCSAGCSQGESYCSCLNSSSAFKKHPANLTHPHLVLLITFLPLFVVSTYSGSYGSCRLRIWGPCLSDSCYCLKRIVCLNSGSLFGFFVVIGVIFGWRVENYYCGCCLCLVFLNTSLLLGYVEGSNYETLSLACLKELYKMSLFFVKDLLHLVAWKNLD